MMRLTLLLLICFSNMLLAQDYRMFQEKVGRLYNLKGSQLDAYWKELHESDNIPIVQHDSVAFVYKGPARSVAWNGDFNGWGYQRKVNNTGVQIPGTDVWILKLAFPTDARLDYKIVLNGSEWILDPFNNDHQWSGVGGGSPNSELKMPAWKQDPTSRVLVPGVPRGAVERDLLFNSPALGYQLMYGVYLPSSYSPNSTYPVVFVTDGYEYMHERMGNMITTLDNLIGQKKIEPIIAVFIDHREPVNRANNRRMQELALNEKYLRFMVEELIPHVSAQYSISKDPSKRAIMGTSMGGLNAAFFAFKRPDVFGLAGIQSPSFSLKPEIYTVCDNPSNPPVKTFMTTGTINDTSEGAVRMKAVLDKNACAYRYVEVNQGHSWGNWRDLTDDILLYFFPYTSGSN